jgi:hypothetical protein
MDFKLKIPWGRPLCRFFVQPRACFATNNLCLESLVPDYVLRQQTTRRQLFLVKGYLESLSFLQCIVKVRDLRKAVF